MEVAAVQQAQGIYTEAGKDMTLLVNANISVEKTGCIVFYFKVYFN
jgi:hypothetical protein